MSMSLFHRADTDGGVFSPATTTRPKWPRQAELPESEYTLRAAIMNDSSPNRYARAHAYAVGHPIIRSFKPGESWRWCYVDEVFT
jgi:hypothetical protein